MRRREGLLEIAIDREAPVEVISIAMLLAKFVHRFEAARELPRDRARIINDD
jgi:hypothetical protein